MVVNSDDDTKVSKHVGVYITERHCCDIYFCDIIVHLLVIIKIIKDAQYTCKNKKNYFILLTIDHLKLKPFISSMQILRIN
jgi:hypothetical protein